MQREKRQNGFQSLLCFALFLILAAACGAPSGHAIPYGAGLPKVSTTPREHSQEHQMFRLLNDDRAAHKLPPLKYDERLAEIGRAHSSDMRDHAFFDHVSPTFGGLENRVDRAGYRNLVARENLAEAADVAKAEASLLASPHHFENIMATDITHVGIGLVPGGVKDPRNLTITQVFAKPSKSETAAEAGVAVQGVIRRTRQEKNLPSAVPNARLTSYADEYLHAALSDSDDLDVKAIGTAISKRLTKEPMSGIKGVSVGSQVMVDSSQFQVPSALLREGQRPFGLAVGEARPPGRRPVLKVLVVVGL